jgi:hypothetical protein
MLNPALNTIRNKIFQIEGNCANIHYFAPADFNISTISS